MTTAPSGEEVHRAHSLPAISFQVEMDSGLRRTTSNPATIRPVRYRRGAIGWSSFANEPSGVESVKSTDDKGQRRGVTQFFALSVAATGVVFGDIGTSPLYTFTGTFDVLGDTHPTSNDIVSAFSMVFWALTLVVSVKYVCVVMRVNHHGEGGTFAMLHTILEGSKINSWTKTAVTFLAMLGVSFIAGDGCITPVVSVLGALEGIPVKMHQVTMLGMAVAILLLIFVVQSRGSQFIGFVAGPVTTFWFLTIAALGVYNLAEAPDAALLVVQGLNPVTIFHFWTTGAYRGVMAWRSLAGVVLAVTGAEALFADMGHFGARPISFAWFSLVYPCLVLQYMGQAAALIVNPDGVVSPFFNAVPEQLVWPMVCLATVAAIIASQAMISGLFSLVAQAHALRFLPRILVMHTNPDEQGQVYIPEVNWALCFMCVVICVAFRTSAALAGAYGIAVTSTFLVTTTLLCVVAYKVWNWHFFSVVCLILPFLIVDFALWSANILKIVDSGWVPVVISIGMCVLMHTHLWGRRQEEFMFSKERAAQLEQIRRTGSIDDFFRPTTLSALQFVLRSNVIHRTDKAAIFMTPYEWRVPHTVGVLATCLGCLPRTIVLLSIKFEEVPFVHENERASFDAWGNGVFNVVLHFGYAEPLTADGAALRKGLSHCAKEHCSEHPELLPLLELDDSCRMLVSSTCSCGTKDEFACMEEGLSHRGQDKDRRTQLQRRQSPAVAPLQGKQGPGLTFVLSKVHYAAQPDVSHGFLNRLRIALYSFLVLNARKPIAFFGLEGSNSIEISVVRFL